MVITKANTQKATSKQQKQITLKYNLVKPVYQYLYQWYLQRMQI